MRPLPFHKRSLQVLTIYVTIGNQAFSHGRLNIFSRFKLQKYVEIHFLIFKYFYGRSDEVSWIYVET